MKDLPKNVTAYKKTPSYNENSIPNTLSSGHLTKEGTWGKICILKGTLIYVIENDPEEIIELSIQKFGVVEPQVSHHVKAQGEVEFYVEFYK
ncbi:DUF1971 domain-containing protein [Halobacteriovorax sp. JY17]|uniref:DUF1971 domain-containing protein n=1 Tax=Halobacteriovorax sp. JY17 TaxID=2014617 RepID=UPI000C6AE7B6|nr:DUF1971 domain-containing protein [Halobacteriovorax sp. JY17]PIK16421.1 MAG: tellurite resistance protein [Halobacteriovorax sp. JY17]